MTFRFGCDSWYSRDGCRNSNNTNMAFQLGDNLWYTRDLEFDVDANKQSHKNMHDIMKTVFGGWKNS